MNQESQYFTQLSIPLAKSSPNFAPAKPLVQAIQDKKLSKTPTKFEQSIREWYTAKMNYEKQAWLEIVTMAQLVALYRKGNQTLQRRPYGGGLYVRPINDSDGDGMRLAMNIMTFHSQVSESKVMAVNPIIRIRPGDDTPEAIATAQACRPVVDCYESEWYTAKYSRREAVRFLTEGMTIAQVRWNPFKGGNQVPSRTVTRQDQVIDPGAGSCADCGYENDADEFQPSDYGHQCPNCGSGAVDVRPAVKDSMAQISMGQSRPVGEPELVPSSLMSWRWDLKYDLESSPWAIKRQYITQGAINLMLGDITIPDSASSDDYGLDILHALTYSGQAFQGSSRMQWYGHDDKSRNRPTMCEAWMSPEDQALIECEEGDTVCGMTLPKGKLSDFFKGQSICVVGLNDMALVVGVYANESHQDEVITAQWLMDADSGVGRGMEDTAGVQKRRNATDGQIYQGLATTATPPVFIDLRMVKEDDGQYLFKPGVTHNLNLSMLPPGMKMADAVYIPPPGGINQQYIQYGTSYLDQMANLSSFAVEFSDLLSIDNRTATGAQISAALANSLYGPMLMSKAESRVEIAKKIVKLQACYGVVGRDFAGKDGAQGRQVKAQDLKGKIIFELVENSHLPVTPYSQQSDATSLIQAFGGALPLAQLKQMDGKLFKALTRPFFALKLEDEDSDDVSTLCLDRLEQMKMMYQSGVTDPNMLVQMIQPPVSQIEPLHKEKADWMSNYLDLPNGQESPIVIRQAIEALYWLHMNLETQKQMPQAVNAGMVQAAGAAPAAIGQAALQGQAPGQPDTTAQDQAHEAEMQQRDQELEAAQHLSGQEHEAKLKAMEGDIQLAVTKQQGANAVESAKIAGQNALKVQRAKPKPKATKAA